MQQHVAQALDAELVSPHQSDGSAETAAFAAMTTLLAIGASYAVPVGGPVAVAAAAATFAPRIKQELRKIGMAPQVERALDQELLGQVLPSKTTDERVKAWQKWLPWEDLYAGKEVDVPQELPHPTCAGFEFTRQASKVGQAVDWVAPLASGRRLHIHEYRDGARSIHCDKMDPGRGPATAVIHWMHETHEGQVLGVALTAALVVFGWMAVEP